MYNDKFRKNSFKGSRVSSNINSYGSSYLKTGITGNYSKPKQLITKANYKKTVNNNFDFGLVGGVLSVFLLAMLIILLFWSLRGDYTISFTSMLNYLSSAPTLDFISISNFDITSSWGVFNFLRDFFNLFARAFAVLTWLGKLIFNVFEWLFFFIQLLFVGIS